MKTTKTKMIFCSLFFSFFVVLNMTAYSQQAPLIKTMQDLCKNFSFMQNVTGDFLQTKTLSKTNKKLVSSGNFLVAQEKGIVWDTKKPFASVMVVGKDFVTQIDATGAKTTLYAQGNDTFLAISNTISSLFSGNIEILQQQFDIDFTTDGNLWQVNLTPKNSSVALFMKKVFMTGKTYIDTLQITEVQGSLIEYKFQNQKQKAVLSEKEGLYFAN